MSWNQENLDTAAFDYYGTVITYGELPDKVNEYVCGLRALGVTAKSVVTLCLPVSIPAFWERADCHDSVSTVSQ